RATGPKDLADLLDLIRGEARAPQPRHHRTLPPRRQAEGLRHQDRALALPDVAVAVLAGEARVAERAQHVVADLERLAERPAVAVQGVAQRTGRAGERGADGERPDDGVRTRLQRAGAARVLLRASRPSRGQ